MVHERRHRRYDASVQVQLSTNGLRLRGETETISRGGMYVRSPRLVGSGLDVWSRLDLPTGEIVLPGRVAYVREDHGMGIRFHEEALPEDSPFTRYIELLDHRSQGVALIVDDDVASAALYTKYLRDADYRVLVASNILQAMDILRYGEVQVVVAEVQMKRMDGLDLTETIRRATESIEVVLVARRPLSPAQRARARQLRVQSVIEGTVTPDVLVQSVDKASLTHPAQFEEDDPWLAETITVEPVTTDIAERRLRELGCTTRTSDKGAVYGQLVFLYHRIHMPFDVSQPVPRVRMGTVNLDHVMLYVPRPLAKLQPIPIMRLPNQMALEAAIHEACEQREKNCRRAKAWLSAIGVNCRLDVNRFACVGHIRIEGEAVAFSSADPSELMLESIRGWTVRDAISEAKRRVDVRGVLSRADLVERMYPAYDAARLAMGPDPFE